MKHKTHSLHDYRGSFGGGILSNLVALAILSFVLLAGMKITVGTTNLHAHNKNALSVMKIKRLALQSVSCTKTLASTCDGLINLKRADGSTIISKRGTKFGPLTARALCDSDTKEIVIQAAQLKPGSDVNANAAADFRKNARGTPVGWESRQTRILPVDVKLCGNAAPVASGSRRNPAMLSSWRYGCKGGFSRSRENAKCPAGMIAIGGGAKCDGGSSDPEIVWSSLNVELNRWEAICCHDQGTPSMKVYVTCMPGG